MCPSCGPNTKVLNCVCPTLNVPPVVPQGVSSKGYAQAQAQKKAYSYTNPSTIPKQEPPEEIKKADLVARLEEILEAEYDAGDTAKIEGDMKALAMALLYALKEPAPDPYASVLGTHVISYSAGQQMYSCLICLSTWSAKDLLHRGKSPNDLRNEICYG